MCSVFDSVDEDRTAVEVLSDTRASIKHDGTVSWSIPAVFQSSCRIEVSSYPYDTQRCALIFGPWSHSSKEVQLQQVRYGYVYQTSYSIDTKQTHARFCGVVQYRYWRIFSCCYLYVYIQLLCLTSCLLYPIN